MRVTIGKGGCDISWQGGFPEITGCCKCGEEARVGFVAHEGFESPENWPALFVSYLYDNKEGEYWPHDCCAVAVYFCKSCCEATALYDQA